MTSPRPETTDRSEPSENEEKPRGVQLSATQVTAGALAAVSSAVVASFFGLAGTLIGAALASVISTVSAALYSSSLQKTNERLRRARGHLTEQQADVAKTGTLPAIPAAPATQVLPAHLDPRRAPNRRSRPRWTKVAVYAAAVFVMAMGIVTGIELIGQRPVSALVGGVETSTTTTISAITTASSSEEESGPSTPSSPTTTPPTESGTPASTDDGSSSEEDGASDSEEPSSAPPSRTSDAEPPTGSESSNSSDESSEDPSQDSAGHDTSPAVEAEPTP